jgi:hypothetical protein
MEQTIPPHIYKLLEELESEDCVRRKIAADLLNGATVSNERIVNALLQAAALDNSPEVAKAARQTLAAPAHRQVLHQQQTDQQVELSAQPPSAPPGRSGLVRRWLDLLAGKISKTHKKGF